MGRWAQRRRSGSDTTAALVASVVSVTKFSSSQLTWTFNVIVTTDGSNSTELRDITAGGSGFPSVVTQITTKSVRCQYGGLVNVGDTWQLTGVPAHITNPNGSGFAVGQSGLVT